MVCKLCKRQMETHTHTGTQGQENNKRGEKSSVFPLLLTQAVPNKREVIFLSSNTSQPLHLRDFLVEVVIGGPQERLTEGNYSGRVGRGVKTEAKGESREVF